LQKKFGSCVYSSSEDLTSIENFTTNPRYKPTPNQVLSDIEDIVGPDYSLELLFFDEVTFITLPIYNQLIKNDTSAVNCEVVNKSIGLNKSLKAELLKLSPDFCLNQTDDYKSFNHITIQSGNFKMDIAMIFNKTICDLNTTDANLVVFKNFGRNILMKLNSQQNLQLLITENCSIDIKKINLKNSFYDVKLLKPFLNSYKYAFDDKKVLYVNSNSTFDSSLLDFYKLNSNCKKTIFDVAFDVQKKFYVSCSSEGLMIDFSNSLLKVNNIKIKDLIFGDGSCSINQIFNGDWFIYIKPNMSGLLFKNNEFKLKVSVLGVVFIKRCSFYYKQDVKMTLFKDKQREIKLFGATNLKKEPQEAMKQIYVTITSNNSKIILKSCTIFSKNFSSLIIKYGCPVNKHTILESSRSTSVEFSFGVSLAANASILSLTCIIHVCLNNNKTIYTSKNFQEKCLSQETPPCQGINFEDQSFSDLQQKLVLMSNRLLIFFKAKENQEGKIHQMTKINFPVIIVFGFLLILVAFVVALFAKHIYSWLKAVASSNNSSTQRRNGRIHKGSSTMTTTSIDAIRRRSDNSKKKLNEMKEKNKIRNDVGTHFRRKQTNITSYMNKQDSLNCRNKNLFQLKHLELNTGVENNPKNRTNSEKVHLNLKISRSSTKV